MGVWVWSRKGPRVGEQFDRGGVCCGGVAPVVAGNGGGENGGPDEDVGLDGLIGEVQEQTPLLANGRIWLRLVVCGCLGGVKKRAEEMVVSDGFLETGPVKKSMDHETYAVAALIQLDMLQRRLNFVRTKIEIQLN
nr:hypothetical protein [Tanacetum cinerariifolium]